MFLPPAAYIALNTFAGSKTYVQSFETKSKNSAIAWSPEGTYVCVGSEVCDCATSVLMCFASEVPCLLFEWQAACVTL